MADVATTPTLQVNFLNGDSLPVPVPLGTMMRDVRSAVWAFKEPRKGKNISLILDAQVLRDGDDAHELAGAQLSAIITTREMSSEAAALMVRCTHLNPQDDAIGLLEVHSQLYTAATEFSDAQNHLPAFAELLQSLEPRILLFGTGPTMHIQTMSPEGWFELAEALGDGVLLGLEMIRLHRFEAADVETFSAFLRHCPHLKLCDLSSNACCLSHRDLQTLQTFAPAVSFIAPQAMICHAPRAAVDLVQMLASVQNSTSTDQGAAGAARDEECDEFVWGMLGPAEIEAC